MIATPTPRLPVPRYDTSGRIPQVRHGTDDLRAVNTALREAVLADERAYAPGARRAVRTASRRYRGVYRVGVDRRLISASTVLVSALLPTTQLYPGGNTGKGWIAVTVRVPSGSRVTLGQLFRDPSIALRVVGGAWLGRLSDDARAFCVMGSLSHYMPTPRNYRFFALTSRGLALGFWQEPACNRLSAVVPYGILRPHLSRLGKELVRGVRAPA